MNLIFWLILAVVSGAATLQWWLRRRDGSSQPDAPVDTYAFTDDDDWPLGADQWSLKDVELLSGGGRNRAVVTIRLNCDDPGTRRHALEKLAREIYRHTEVEAVFVQARRPDEQPDLYLLAADGRGWWGDEMLSTAIAGKDF